MIHIYIYTIEDAAYLIGIIKAFSPLSPYYYNITNFGLINISCSYYSNHLNILYLIIFCTVSFQRGKLYSSFVVFASFSMYLPLIHEYALCLKLSSDSWLSVQVCK